MSAREPGAGPGGEAGPEDDEAVPLFGTWARIYAAVLVWLAVVMAGIALFSRWPF